MAVTAATLRTFMLLDSVVSIPDGAFTQAVADAEEQVTYSDDLLTKYFAAYLLAVNVDWQAVKKTGQTEFFAPKPDNYNKLYTDRLNYLISKDAASDDNNLSTGGIARSDPKDEVKSFDEQYYL